MRVLTVVLAIGVIAGTAFGQPSSSTLGKVATPKASVAGNQEPAAQMPTTRLMLAVTFGITVLPDYLADCGTSLPGPVVCLVSNTLTRQPGTSPPEGQPPRPQQPASGSPSRQPIIAGKQ